MNVQRKAKVFSNSRSHAVRSLKESQFSNSEVLSQKQGDGAVLSRRPNDWSAYLASDAVASDEFMQGVEGLPVQERSL